MTTPDPRRDALERIEGWSRFPKGLTRPTVRLMVQQINGEARRALAAQPAPPLDVAPQECWTCGGSGWVWGIDADPLPSGEPGEPYQVQEACSDCGGSGQAQPAPPLDVERLAEAITNIEDAGIRSGRWDRLTGADNGVLARDLAAEYARLSEPKS